MSQDRQTHFFEHDHLYMQHAYDLALKAFNNDEIPVGALVVSHEGIILGTGYNQTEHQKCQIAHAEMLAIKAACADMRDWRLEKATLYVTLQPCMMCYGLIALSRIERVVYGVPSPVYGFEVDSLDKDGVYTKHTKSFSHGIMKDKIESILKDFFKKVRS